MVTNGEEQAGESMDEDETDILRRSKRRNKVEDDAAWPSNEEGKQRKGSYQETAKGN